MEKNILGFKSKSSYYEKTKQFLSQDKPRWVSVWVESDDDKKLWFPILKSKYERCQFKFHIASLEKFEDGVIADGCSRLIALIKKGSIELGKANIACLDSDYSYISGNYNCKQKEILQSNFAFGTNVHSKENILAHPVGVSYILERSLGEDLSQFDIDLEGFSTGISNALFECFVKLISLYCVSDIDKFDYFHAKFIRILKSSLTGFNIPEDLKGDIKSLMDESYKEFNVELDAYLCEGDSDNNMKSARERFNELNVSENDILSFIRGHDLYAVMMPIYKAIDNYIFNKKRERYNQEHIPSDVRGRKLGELANKRLKVEDVICGREDTTRNVFFQRAFVRMDVVLN